MANGGIRTADEAGWWNRTGSEECTVCAARFDYEVEERCADCDAPVCPLCAVEVEVRTTVVCVPCEAARKGSAGRREER